MHGKKREKAVRLAVAGMGNCASSLIEGISYYAQHPEDRRGLLFPTLGGYAVTDIEVVAAFDISRARAEIGYNPKIALREGIQRTLDWYRQQGWL